MFSFNSLDCVLFTLQMKRCNLYKNLMIFETENPPKINMKPQGTLKSQNDLPFTTSTKEHRVDFSVFSG